MGVAHPCYDAQVIVPLLQGGWAGGGKFGNVFSFSQNSLLIKLCELKEVLHVKVCFSLIWIWMQLVLLAIVFVNVRSAV